MNNVIAMIHRRALDVAKKYKAAEIDLIEILEEVGKHRVFYHFKYNSLFQYAVGALGLSEEVAYIFINVSRKAAEVPKLKEEIKAGNISVSKAKTISAVLNSENQDHWLELAKTSSKRQIEREVAIASPKHAVREQAIYKSGEMEEHAKILDLPEVHVELKLGLPERVMLKLRQAQDLISQSKQGHASLAETLEAALDDLIQKRDPLEKAKRQKMRGKLNANVKSLVPGPVNVDGASSIHKNSASSAGAIAADASSTNATTDATSRRPFTAAIRHQLNLKFQRQCAHTDEQGRRCPQRRYLHIHHITPISEGGTNEIENLEILCAGHHRAYHLQPSG